MKRVYYEVEKKTEITSKKGYYEIDDSYTQMYESLSKIAFRMKSVIESQFLFFACAHSNDDGVFLTDSRMFERFNRESIENGGKSVTPMTIHTAVKNLTESKIFIKLNRGQYQLNPLLLWNGSIVGRENTITTICESDDKHKYLLNESETNYKPTYKIN